MDGFRVLFVDDEEELVGAVVERLELRNIDAAGATSGEQALALLEKNSFDVVVLDVRMPGLGGLDVIKRIKSSYPNLEVVLLSGHGSSEDVNEGLRLGAVDYLQKPVDLDVLIQILREAASRGARKAP